MRHLLPITLTNILDWVSRPYGKNLWAGKPAGMVGASVRAVGTVVAQTHLRSVLGYFDVPTLGQPEVLRIASVPRVYTKSNFLRPATRANASTLPCFR